MSEALADLLRPGRLTEVVDIGANPHGEDPPYKAMLAAGACRGSLAQGAGQRYTQLLARAGVPR